MVAMTAAQLPISDVYWSPALGDGGIVSGVADIEQSIQFILSTYRGDVPLRPEFGSRIHDYIDRPSNTIKAHLAREIRAALEHPTEGEPRARFDGLDLDADAAGSVVLVVNWSLAGTAQRYQTKVVV